MYALTCNNAVCLIQSRSSGFPGQEGYCLDCCFSFQGKFFHFLVLLNSRFHYEISVFIHSIKFLILFITSPFLILHNVTNKDRIVTIIMIHCSFMFDSLLLYSAASFNSFRILSICTFVSLILLDIPSRLLDDLFLI